MLYEREPILGNDLVELAVARTTGNTACLAKEVLEDTNYLQEIAKKLKLLLENEKEVFRPQQKAGLEGAINGINSGEHKGLVKLATGVGKTFLFGKMLRVIGGLNVVLVPNIPLIGNTKDELVGNSEKSGVGFSENEVFTISSEKDGDLEQQVTSILEQSKRTQNGVILMTYAGLNVLGTKKPELLNDIFSRANIVISDEGHRSIGEKTQKHLLSLSTATEDSSIDQAEEMIEEIIRKKIHLYFTATPGLSNKSVLQFAKPFYMGKISDAVNDGTLVLPTARLLGHAYAVCPNPGSDTTKDYEHYRYYDEDGNNLDDTLLDEYIAEKDAQGNYLPGIYACRDIAHAQEVTQLALSKGIKAVRVTSGNKEIKKGMDAREAKNGIENGEIDLVVTVRQVAEGWDVRTLRAYIQGCAIMSPAKSIQLCGRIMRTLSENDLKIYPAKNTENTLYIAPRSWDVYNPLEISGTGASKIIGEGNGKGEIAGGIMNTFDMLHELGEMMEGDLEKAGYRIEGEKAQPIRPNEKGEVILNGVKYQALHPDFGDIIFELTGRSLDSIIEEGLGKISMYLQRGKLANDQICYICPIGELDKYDIRSFQKVTSPIVDGIFEHNGVQYFVDGNDDLTKENFKKVFLHGWNLFIHSSKNKMRADARIKFFIDGEERVIYAIRADYVKQVLSKPLTKSKEVVMELEKGKVSRDGQIEIDGEIWQIYSKYFEGWINKRYIYRTNPPYQSIGVNIKSSWKQEVKKATYEGKKVTLVKITTIERVLKKKQ